MSLVGPTGTSRRLLLTPGWHPPHPSSNLDSLCGHLQFSSVFFVGHFETVYCHTIFISVAVLPDPCKPLLPLLQKQQPLGDRTLPRIFYHSHIHSIFLASFPSTFIAIPHRSCCCWRFAVEVAFSFWCPLLKAGVPVAAGILAVANIPTVACFPAVAWMS